jgi:hypothetical protein
MAKRETVVFTCDLHQGDMTEGVETVTFGLDGASYEVDACKEHREELHDAFARYMGAARRAGSGSTGGSGGRRTARTPSRSSSSGGSDREEVQRIREWAREHGHKVSERGRLSSSVLEAYRAAQ